MAGMEAGVDMASRSVGPPLGLALETGGGVLPDHQGKAEDLERELQERATGLPRTNRVHAE